MLWPRWCRSGTFCHNNVLRGCAATRLDYDARGEICGGHEILNALAQKIGQAKLTVPSHSHYRLYPAAR
jgi:hypothetical protein